MKRLLFALPLLSLCVGCGQIHRNFPDFSRFPSTDDETLTYLSRNGDNFGQEKYQAYSEVFRRAEMNPISTRLDGGEGVFLYLYADNCSTCKAVRENVVTFVKESGMEGFAVDFTESSKGFAFIRELTASYSSFSNIYGTDGSISTPTAFLLRKDKAALQLPFIPFNNSLDELENYFTGLMNLTNIITFRTSESMSSFAKSHDGLAFSHPGDATFFYEHIYPQAIHSGRFTYFYENEQPYLESDKSLFLIEGGEVVASYDIEKAPEEALTCIEDYYG